MYTSTFYGNVFDSDTISEKATWSLLGATKPSYGNKEIEDIIGEANIIGITISDAAFGSMSPLQFPGGIKINSTHPQIHTRIQRTLDSTTKSLSSIECNVVRIRTPNIRFEKVEFDNTGCQESAMNIASSHTGEEGQFQKMFKNFKGWNMAAVRLTKAFADSDPKNIEFVNVKFTSAERFRKIFPGRPLISVDNEVRQKEWVDVDKLYISNANDTFSYVIEAMQKVNLAPLDMIMWNYKGRLILDIFLKTGRLYHMHRVVPRIRLRIIIQDRQTVWCPLMLVETRRIYHIQKSLKGLQQARLLLMVMDSRVDFTKMKGIINICDKSKLFGGIQYKNTG